MSLEKEIQKAAKEIVKDGYEMSIGELMNMYKDDDLIINPDFQRYFRWEISQKTRFFESILLGIPIPPIFVYQNEDGKWELVDGLQRLSTIFEFTGLLKKPDGDKYTPSILKGTKLLPSLNDKHWKQKGDKDKNAFSPTIQRDVKRARIRVEILKKESDAYAKYELFQRLNTGGSKLSEQEVRTCTMIMINKPFAEAIKALSRIKDYTGTLDITSAKKTKQTDVELVLRLLVYRNFPYQKGLDVHEYLDDGTIFIAKKDDFDLEEEKKCFKETFKLINESLGKNAFKKYDGRRFLGQFLVSAYDAIAYGISQNIKTIKAREDSKEFILEKVKALWQDQYFTEYSAAGTRGTTRIEKLIPYGKKFFKP